MVATGQEMVREKNFFTVREKSVKFHFESGKSQMFERTQEKVKF